MAPLLESGTGLDEDQDKHMCVQIIDSEDA
jgi:hypothetical protein